MSKKINFTKTTLLSLKPTTSGKRLVVWDTKVQGLQCRITDKGVATFSLYRRLKNGRSVRITLGKLSDISVEQARDQATLLNAEIAKGKDPARLRQEKREEMTFQELFDEYFHSYAKAHKKTWAGDECRYRLYLAKPLGKKKLSDIRRADFVALYNHLCRQPSPLNKTAFRIGTANRILRTAGGIFKWAVRMGYCQENPVRGVTQHPDKSRDRFLQPEEFSRFFEALQQEKNLDVRDYVLLSLYTGARQGNILTMRWEEISVQQKIWRIPVSKNGEPVVVPLIEEALAILQERRKKASDFVFPANTKSGYMQPPRKQWKAILKRAKIRNLRLHDLRRTMGSWQAITGSSLSVIGKSLGHKSQAATAIYARLHLDPVRKSMETATAAMFTAAQQGENDTI